MREASRAPGHAEPGATPHEHAAQLAQARAAAASALQRAEEEWPAASSLYDEATG